MSDKKKEKTIKFEAVKEDIIDNLKKRGHNSGINESVTLIDGFVMQPFNSELSGSVIIGGKAVPMIMCIGNVTGRVYYFALKAIIELDKL